MVRGEKLTKSSDNLRLQPKLILEPSGKITHPALPISRHIGNLPNMVEHVPGREQEDGDQGDRGPEVAVLDDGQQVRGCDGAEGDQTQHRRRRDGEFHVVERPPEFRVRDVGELAREPGVDGFGFVGAVMGKRG